MKHYFKHFTSEDVQACGISRSVNRAAGENTFGYRDVLKKASELGISFHTNRWGSLCFTAYQAERIRQELLKDCNKDNRYTRALSKQKPEEENGATAVVLEEFSDRELADELRRRGWEFEAKRIETL